MSGKILKFGTDQIGDEPNENLIAELERLLGDAKSGHLRAIAYATVCTDGVRGTGWDGSTGTRPNLSEAVVMLHHRYVTLLLEGEI